MPAGEAFTPDQRRWIERSIKQAKRSCGYQFAVLVGMIDGDLRSYAIARHGELPHPAESVLIVVDPTQRALEVVTGASARRRLDDSSVELAALAMQSTFAAGDLLNGIVVGINQLADHARAPRTLHEDTPLR